MLEAKEVKTEPEVENLRSSKDENTLEIEILELQYRYKEAIGWLCFIIAGLITLVLVLTGWIEWTIWYKLLSAYIVMVGTLTFALIEFVLWLIDKKRKADTTVD